MKLFIIFLFALTTSAYAKNTAILTCKESYTRDLIKIKIEYTTANMKKMKNLKILSGTLSFQQLPMIEINSQPLIFNMDLLGTLTNHSERISTEIQTLNDREEKLYLYNLQDDWDELIFNCQEA